VHTHVEPHQTSPQIRAGYCASVIPHQKRWPVCVSADLCCPGLEPPLQPPSSTSDSSYHLTQTPPSVPPCPPLLHHSPQNRQGCLSNLQLWPCPFQPPHPHFPHYPRPSQYYLPTPALKILQDRRCKDPKTGLVPLLAPHPLNMPLRLSSSSPKAPGVHPLGICLGLPPLPGKLLYILRLSVPLPLGIPQRPPSPPKLSSGVPHSPRPKFPSGPFLPSLTPV
jgi:hypothetical protein